MDFKSFQAGKGKLEQSVAKMKDQNPKFKKDERFWLPTKDDSGSSNALIRFMPQPDIEKAPTISFFQHGFKEKGKWFIDNCPTTFERPCPVCEHIQPYWDEDTEESMNYARRYSRTKQFVANILVINDLNNPKMNGLVKLFKFGIKLYEKIEEKIFPESEIDDPIQIFDPWEGCGFKLKLRQKSKRNNYDNSEFASKCGPVAKNDEALEVIFNQLYSLDEFLADDKFPTYEKMSKKFNRIMKLDGGKTAAKQPKDDVGDKLLDEFEDGPEKAADTNDKSNDKAADASSDKAADEKTPNAGADEDFNFEDDPGTTDAAASDEKKTDAAAGETATETKKSSEKPDDDFNFDDNDPDFDFEEA
jgi:hypothetical protein